MIQRVVIAVVLVGVSCSLYELDLEFLSVVGSANEAILLVLFAQVSCSLLLLYPHRVGVYLSVFFLFFILSKKKKLFQKATGRLQLYYSKYSSSPCHYQQQIYNSVYDSLLYGKSSHIHHKHLVATSFHQRVFLCLYFSIHRTTHPSYALPLSLLHLFLGQYIYSFFIHLVTNNPTPYSTSINNEKRESTFLIYYIILFSVQFFIFRFNLQRYMNIYLLVSLYVIVGIGLIRFPIVTIWLKE